MVIGIGYTLYHASLDDKVGGTPEGEQIYEEASLFETEG